MVDYCGIENVLAKLDSEYNLTTDTMMAVMYSKLAILELCGWIEDSVDAILYDYVSRNVLVQDNVDKVSNMIQSNYGFTYEGHLYPLMDKVLGIKNLELVLSGFSSTDFQHFKSVLGTYKNPRNRAAHKYFTLGITPNFNAPSTVKADYFRLKPGIQYLEVAIGRL